MQNLGGSRIELGVLPLFELLGRADGEAKKRRVGVAHVFDGSHIDFCLCIRGDVRELGHRIKLFRALCVVVNLKRRLIAIDSLQIRDDVITRKLVVFLRLPAHRYEYGGFFSSIPRF